MPRSKLVPELRYGGSGYASFRITDGAGRAYVSAYHADYFVDSILMDRIAADTQGRFRVYPVLDTRPSTKDLDE